MQASTREWGKRHIKIKDLLTYPGLPQEAILVYSRDIP